MLAHFPKAGSAAGGAMSSHREIGLAPNVAKKLRKIVRMRLQPTLDAAARPGQMCGIAHRGVGIASLHAQAFFQCCRRYKRSGGVLCSPTPSRPFTACGGAVQEELL